ncbi:MAG: energy transducer TonB [Crocinitomicaceae bacterium]|nr:energy transducer TonB [Crocinitomicaceae bacterium]
MGAIVSVIILVLFVSLYDYFSARKWQQVTSSYRNELVFENRNKRYGAYEMRRNYDRRLIIIMLGIIVAISASYGAYLYVKSMPEDIVEPPPMDLSQFTVAAPPLEEVEPPPIEEEIPPMEKTIEFLPPVVTDDEVTTPPPTQESMENVSASTVTNDIEMENFAPPVVAKAPPVEKAPEPVYMDVEESAEYPGGRAAMQKFLSDKIKYPETAIQQGIEGKCYLRFIVGTDGTIKDVRVTRGVPDCPECDAEARRVVRSMPKWKPGKIGGKGVQSYFDLPVNFKFN